MKIRNFFIGLFTSVLLILVLIFTSVNAVGGTVDDFDDVSGRHPNVKAIEYLQDSGVVVGYGDGTFGPARDITRAEFLKIVMEAYGYSVGGSGCYSDVASEWYAQYICTATDQGLVDGYPDGKFRPNQPINFAEASKIVVNAFKLDVENVGIGVWFEPYVLSLENEEAIPHDVDGFDKNLTRAQMSEMAWRVVADRTYKLSNTFANIEKGQAIEDSDSELYTFGSCKELHDYFEDNSREPNYASYVNYEMSEDASSDATAVAPSMAEKGGCFTGETQILMADGGYKSIENIEEGDLILTRENAESSELVPGEVESTISHYVPGYLVINDDLEVTAEHVVFVNGEWDVAGNVEEGDYLMNADGTEVEVYSIYEVNEPVWVYNFEVDDYHTYVANDFYVHNDKGAAAGDYSSTNVQVEGVDEADIVKNDGKYIYFLKGRTVRIVEAYPPSGMSELDRIDFGVDFGADSFYPKEMYVDGDTMVVVGTLYHSNYYDDYEEKLVDPAYYSRNSVKVFVLDISDRENVELSRELSIEGSYSSSRKVNDVVYLVANHGNSFWPWGDAEDWKEEDLVPLNVEDGKLDKLVSCDEIMYMPQVIDATNYLIVAAVPLDPDEDISQKVVMGSSSEIYSSRENLYVAQERYSQFYWYEDTADEEETYIHKFSLDSDNIGYEGMGIVPGSILNQFSMDEHEGNFRIATTVGDVWNDETLSTNNLYVLSPDLDLVGSVEDLAPGERIYSARFVGDRAYMVTFKEIDPLFVISVEDPENPEVLGELKIPGFSDYLHPYDENHLIGFGLDAEAASAEEIEYWGLDFAWFQGVKLAMFDVTDVENPVELHREIIGDRGTSSPLRYNHKTLMYSTTKGVDDGALMAFPVTVAELSEEVKNDPDTPANTFGDYVFQGAYVYDVSPEDGFRLRGTVTHYDDEELLEAGYYWYGLSDIERVVYIGDYLYTVSQASVMANEIQDIASMVNTLDLVE